MHWALLDGARRYVTGLGAQLTEGTIDWRPQQVPYRDRGAQSLDLTHDDARPTYGLETGLSAFHSERSEGLNEGVGPTIQHHALYAVCMSRCFLGAHA